jgi:hypothetical protein
VIFCSQADNITPPQQALGWITDIYETDEDLIANGQTVVYCLHATVGHLGIFVSGKVAAREHEEFTSAMDMIDVMPPGLYEAIIEDVGDDTANRDLVSGSYLFRLEPRTLADIRALGGNSLEDDRKFAAAERVSTINRRLYESYVAPVIRSITPPAFGEWSRKMHPNRVRFAIFSDENPAMHMVESSAQDARENRTPVGEDNPFVAAEKMIAETIKATLSAYGHARDLMTEQLFHLTYGSPLVQAFVGLDPTGAQDGRKPSRDALREQARARRRADLEQKFEEGAAIEAILRSIIYIRRAEGSVDERGFAMLMQLYEEQPPGRPRSMDEIKKAMHDQSLLIRIDEVRAVAAIPKLLPANPAERSRIFRAVMRLANATGSTSGEGKRRLAEVRKLFGLTPVEAKKVEAE